MNTHRLTCTTLAAATCLLGAPALAAVPGIEDLAPPSTMFLIGVDDVDGFYGDLKNTGLWELIQTMLEDEEGPDEMIDELLEELELERDEVAHPTGRFELAVFTTTSEATMQAQPGMLITIDFEKNIGKAVQNLEHLIERGAEEGEIEHDEKEIGAHKVHVLTFVDDEPLAAPIDADPFGDMGLEDMIDFDSMFEESMSSMYVVKADSSFIVSSDLNVITRALDVVDGEAIRSIGQREAYQLTRDAIGENEAYGMVLTGNLGGLISAMDPMGMSGMIAPMLKQVVGDIQGIGNGVRVSDGESMLSQRMAVVMPNGKAGLSALMTRAAPRGKMPAFVGSNTLSYTTMNFDFKGIPNAVRPLMGMLQMFIPDPEMHAEINRQMEGLTSNLGGTMHAIQTVDRPVTPESVGQLMAIELEDPQKMEQWLSNYAAQSGMEAHEMLGHRVYSMENAMGMMPMEMGDVPPMAAAIASRHVYLGSQSAVEQAIRVSADARAAAQLMDDPIFVRAASVLSNDPVCGWGVQDLASVMAVESKVAEMNLEAFKRELAQDPNAAAELEAMGLTPEDMMDAGPWAKKFGDEAFLRRYFGPLAWQMMPTETGYVVESFMLAPQTTAVVD